MVPGFLRENAPWLGAGFLISLLSTFGQTSFVSVFAGALIEGHGLTEGSWAAIYAIGTTASAAAMVWAGGLADTVPLPRLTAWMLAGLAASCAGMALAPGVWALPILVLGLRFFGQGMMSHIASVATARWFVRSRGRALAITAFGFAAGQATLPLLYTAALGRVPAPALWLASAAICLAAIVPVTRLIARPRRPRGTAEGEDEAAGIGGRHWTRPEVLRTALFWGLVPALIGTPAFGTAFLFFQVHLPAVKGWSQVGFVALFPVLMGASIASTFAAGALIDRHGASRLLAPALLPMAAGFLLLAGADSLTGAIPAVILLAITQGAMNTVPVALWAEQFGTRHIGAVKAASVAIMVLATALGPGLVGMLIDRGVDFPAQMPWIAAYIAASSALAALALRRGVRLLPA